MGLLFDYALHSRFKSYRFPVTTLISLVSYFLLSTSFHNTVSIIKGIIFIQLLFCAAYHDAKTHEIPPAIPLLILLDGLIQLHLPQAAIGFFLVSVPLLFLSKITGGGAGGGDIKLMAACGFVLEPAAIIIAAMLSSLFFLIIYLLLYPKKQNAMYAMAPYIGVGCFFAYLMM